MLDTIVYQTGIRTSLEEVNVQVLLELYIGMKKGIVPYGKTRTLQKEYYYKHIRNTTMVKLRNAYHVYGYVLIIMIINSLIEDKQ